jgi:hypothetical protein
VWSEFKTSEGNVYYYNKVTRQSVWETPPDVDLVMPLPASLDDGPSNIERVTASSQPNDIPTTPQQLDALKPLDPPPISMAINIPPDVPIREIESEPMEINSTELLALVAAKLGTGPPPSAVPLKPAPKTEEKKGTRPIESVPIPGTPWSIVFTNDKRRFFFDATLRKSVWSMPSELENLPSVMKILENPPWRKSNIVIIIFYSLLNDDYVLRYSDLSHLCNAQCSFICSCAFSINVNCFLFIERVGELEEPSAKKIKFVCGRWK